LTIAILLGVSEASNPAAPKPPPEAPDVADVPCQDLRADGDSNKRYFLIGTADKDKAPASGYRLLIVLSGGDGSADFNPFIRRIYKNALKKDWLIAQLVAPRWDEQQANRIVWPTQRTRYPGAKFTTEQFIDAVIADVQAKTRIDPQKIFLFGWSSGGPACYAAMLREDTPVAGAFIAMSVFMPPQASTLAHAKGKAFYLLQSPDDKVTRMRFAEAARKALEPAGAIVKLQPYPGGHGWRGNVFGMISAGVEWLDKASARSSPAAESAPAE
jgi:predicted esterase